LKDSWGEEGEGLYSFKTLTSSRRVCHQELSIKTTKYEFHHQEINYVCLSSGKKQEICSVL